MKRWCVAALFAIVAILIAWQKYALLFGGSHELVIGVLSSRDHFQYRKIIRNEFKDAALISNVLLKFIVSKIPCNIPVEDRLDEFRCEANSYSKANAEIFTSHCLQSTPKNFDLIISGQYGLDFQVNHPIIIHELGVYDHDQNGIKGLLKVILYNYATKDVVTEAAFMSFSSGEKDGFYRYKPTKKYILPKGFYGSLVVQGVSRDDPILGNADCIVDSGGGLIMYKKLYRSECATDKIFPGFQNHYYNTSCFIAGPSFKYSSYDINETDESGLEQIKRYRTYGEKMQEEERELQTEYLEHRDILFVDVVESYRMLPMKMLEFYSWLSTKEFHFVLKTDDDCFINVTAILQMLQDTLRNGKNNVVIGSFRQNFALDQHGKWAERDFVSLTYPPFPCGSGYLLSKDIVDWISNNKFYLKIYQGEDVSLGIWLSAINVYLINDNRFKCAKDGFANTSFTSPDHTVEELKNLFGAKRNK